MSQAETVSKIKINEKIAEPPRFKVIFINDNQTSMEFVIGSLVEYFEYSIASAEQITASIHEAGSAVVAVLPYEIAEQKGIEITLSARAEGYPLQIKLEPESAT
jgi:ATP-dependent Clp protease adaptor protein ClpS